MTIANNLIALALRNAGVNGVGQTALPEDVNDAFTLLNDMIGGWNLQRRVQANPIVLTTFPNLTVDQPFWTPYENVLVTTLAVRLRSAYALPPDELMVKVAENAMGAFQAINQQQIAPPHAGPPTTCIQLIYLALRLAGRITDMQSVTDGSKDVADAFAMLVMMMGQWQRKRWLVPDLTDVAFVSTGALSYTVGPAGNFVVPRPDRIDSAFARLLATSGGSTFDYQLGIIGTREEYNRIGLKSLHSVPSAVFYDSAFPVGNAYFWPVPPSGQYELHLSVKSALPVYATVNDALNLAPEYTEALLYSLAVRMSDGEPKPWIVQSMRAALATVRSANMQIGEMRLPAVLSGSRGTPSTGQLIGGMW
jgi:hypothetical protein